MYLLYSLLHTSYCKKLNLYPTIKTTFSFFLVFLVWSLPCNWPLWIFQAFTAKLISIDPLCECSVQPLCLCIQIKLTKFGHKSEEGPDLQHRIFVRLMYYYLFFLVLLYHGHQKRQHVGADIKYMLVFTSASLKLHIL